MRATQPPADLTKCDAAPPPHSAAAEPEAPAPTVTFVAFVATIAVLLGLIALPFGLLLLSYWGADRKR